MLTVHHENDKIFNALCAGACGYILKNEPFPLIKKAVIDISEGGSYMSPSIARRVTEYFNPTSHSPEEELTTREKEVIEWISEGYSNKAIADRLSVSLHTVKFHLRNIYSKLHISSKNELIRKTLRKEI
jgi:DNA-binding NarL/FixJ family response regulator